MHHHAQWGQFKPSIWTLRALLYWFYMLKKFIQLSLKCKYSFLCSLHCCYCWHRQVTECTKELSWYWCVAGHYSNQDKHSHSFFAPVRPSQGHSTIPVSGFELHTHSHTDMWNNQCTLQELKTISWPWGVIWSKKKKASDDESRSLACRFTNVMCK